MFFSIPPRSGLIAIENIRPIFISYSAQALFTLLAAYPLIAWLGIWGAPVGLLVLQLINITLLSWAFSRVSRLLPRAESETGDS